MPNKYGKERPSKTKAKQKPEASMSCMLGSGLAAAAARILGSRQQQIESAVNDIPQPKPKSEKY